MLLELSEAERNIILEALVYFRCTDFLHSDEVLAIDKLISIVKEQVVNEMIECPKEFDKILLDNIHDLYVK